MSTYSKQEEEVEFQGFHLNRKGMVVGMPPVQYICKHKATGLCAVSGLHRSQKEARDEAYLNLIEFLTTEGLI